MTKMAKNKNNKEEAIALDVELRKSEAFIEKHLKKILIVLAAVIVVVAGFFIYKNHMESVEAEAQGAIAKAQAQFYQEQYETALNGDGAASKGFLNIISDYSSTETANLAKLYAGLSYYNLKKYEDAVKYLEEFDAKDDKSISPTAVAALGNCYVQLDQKEKGAETLLKAAKQADSNLSAVFMVQAAIVYEGLGQNDKALGIYNDVKANYQTSPLYQEMDKYIERVSK